MQRMLEMASCGELSTGLFLERGMRVGKYSCVVCMAVIDLSAVGTRETRVLGVASYRRSR